MRPNPESSQDQNKLFEELQKAVRQRFARIYAGEAGYFQRFEMVDEGGEQIIVGRFDMIGPASGEKQSGREIIRLGVPKVPVEGNAANLEDSESYFIWYYRDVGGEVPLQVDAAAAEELSPETVLLGPLDELLAKVISYDLMPFAPKQA